MSKFFGVLSKNPAQSNSKLKPKRFSRFQDAIDGTARSPDADKKFSRFSAQDAPTQTDLPALTEVRSEPDTAHQNLDRMDHLNSEAEIPVSILVRALPQRFAEMRDERRGTAHA